MATFRARLALTALLGIAYITPARAQVVDTPEGTVEFVGLRQWTVPMLQDSMRIHAPGLPLGQCAGVLRLQLGFPSADVLHAREPDGRPCTVVTVVEPGPTAPIAPARAFTDSLPVPADWQPAAAALRQHQAVYGQAVNLYPLVLRGDTLLLPKVLRLYPADTALMHRLWTFWGAHRSPADQALALRTLRSERNFESRILAAGLLANWLQADSTWYALMDVVADDPADPVTAAAADVLQAAGAYAPRRVDWVPSAPALRRLVAGVHLFNLRNVIHALHDTQLDPALGRTLLRGNADLLLAMLATHHPEPRATALAALRTLSGQDLGSSPEAWAAWLRTL